MHICVAHRGERHLSKAAFEGDRQKTKVIAQLYDVALDPLHAPHLWQIWRDSNEQSGPSWPFTDAEVIAHAKRAAVILAGGRGFGEDMAHLQDVLSAILCNAAFVVDGNGRIVALNGAASKVFGLSQNATLADLPLEWAAQEALAQTVQSVLVDQRGRVVPLRLHMGQEGGPFVLRLSRLNIQPSLALVVTSLQLWPDGFDLLLGGLYDLTKAELEVIQSLSMGALIPQIARQRQRSLETVRTQMRSILQKTEARSQADLVRLVQGLVDVAQVPVPMQPITLGRGIGQARTPNQIVDSSGRNLTWLEFGAPAGRVILFMHGLIWGADWPETAKALAAQMGWRIILPIRAGFGQSDPPARGSLQETVQDYAAVLDYLGLHDVIVMPFAEALDYGLALAQARPDMVAGVLGLPHDFDQQAEPWRQSAKAIALYQPELLSFWMHFTLLYWRRIGAEAFCSAKPLLSEQQFDEALSQGIALFGGDAEQAARAISREMIALMETAPSLLQERPVSVHLLLRDSAQEGGEQGLSNLTHGLVSETAESLFFNNWQLILQECLKFAQNLPKKR